MTARIGKRRRVVIQARTECVHLDRRRRFATLPPPIASLLMASDGRIGLVETRFYKLLLAMRQLHWSARFWRCGIDSRLPARLRRQLPWR